MRFAFLLAIMWFSLSLSGQFFLNGEAVALNDSCYQLTPAQNWSAGSIWNPDKINLYQSFDVVMQISLGCKDQDGADGIVFGFQPVSTSIGQAGGGIGFANIVPSLGIEFDTYQNDNLGDPSYDHIAIIRDGRLNHNSSGNLAGPIQASPTRPNIEDCEFHDLRVSWDTSAERLDVYFDCELRLSYQGDLIQNVFGGDPEVFWGFTSATGALNNLQQVCFNYTTFLDELEDVVLCPGGQVRLSAKGGIAYHWEPATGLSDPDIANPFASPARTTTYTVEVLDACNRPFFDDVTVEVAGDSVFFDLGPDTSICEGQTLLLDVATPTATYTWSTGSDAPQLPVEQGGEYAVTVTRTDTFCTASDVVVVDLLQSPEADLGPDLSLCNGETTSIGISSPNSSFEWQNGSNGDSITVISPGTYSVTATNNCGTASDDVLIEFEDCSQIYLPNAFSPNDDGFNDRFYPMDGGDVENIPLLRIFDRWGNLLYEETDLLSNDINRGWDGKSRGEPLDPGMYVWFLEVVFRDGSSATLSGEVYLVR